MDPQKLQILSSRETRQARIRDLLQAGTPGLIREPGKSPRKPMAKMSTRERQRYAPRPASELPYQRLMVQLRREIGNAIGKFLKIEVSERADSSNDRWH